MENKISTDLVFLKYKKPHTQMWLNIKNVLNPEEEVIVRMIFFNVNYGAPYCANLKVT